MASGEGSPGDPEQRLHPWSWLFVLLQQLKQFILPLIVLVVFGGGGDRGGLWADFGPLIAVGVLVVIAILRYFTYRYRTGRDGLTIRSGWLHRSVREIPYARIHNVVVHQSLLHRLFNVAEVRLESAGGQRPEAEMRVLSLPAAAALENLIRHRGQAAPATGDSTPAVPAADVLLALPWPEILRLGLISNRGMVVVAAAFGTVWQILPDRMMANLLERYSRAAFGYASHLQWTWTGALVSGLSLLLLAWLLTRLLSVVMATLQFHGFRLSESERRLTVERGLLTRLRTSVARRRIQAWTLREGFMHRLLDRRTLRIDTAVVDRGGDNEHRALKVLAPIAPPAACDDLIRHLLPQADWPPAEWRPWPRHAGWRLWWPALVGIGLAGAVLSMLAGPWGLLVLLLLPWSAFAAHRNARRAGHSVNEHLIAVRGGWWSRWWRFAEIDKLQALRLSRSPIDRWCGTATLWLDTAGDAGLAPPLRLRFLPYPDAQALYAHLGAALAQRRLRW